MHVTAAAWDSVLLHSSAATGHTAQKGFLEQQGRPATHILGMERGPFLTVWGQLVMGQQFRFSSVVGLQSLFPS